MINLIILILSLWFIYACYMHSIKVKQFIYKVIDFNSEMLGEKPTFKELKGILR